MSQRTPTVLMVEDSPAQAQLLAGYLRDLGYGIHHVATGEAARPHLRDRTPDVVLLDLGLPDIDGMDLLREIEAQAVPTAVIVVTGEQGSINTAVEAMRHGAQDFVVKPVDKRRLQVSVKNAVERQELRALVETYQEDIARSRYFGFIGSSLAMQRVYRIIDSAGPSKATVFITGESGTGKEVGAEAIHRRSPRHQGPFVPINCAAIPDDLMESELFGHVKGAFTGAVQDREGAAIRADGGTLFMDEICEMELHLQTKLLRFLQTGTVQRVGGTRLETVDVRIVCATNRDPMEEVRAGRFREDLFYRLHVIPIHLPPLREREEDVMEIAETLLTHYAREEGKRFQRFSDDARDVLRGYDFPGNIRELQNIIRHIVVLSEGETVTADMLPPPLDPGGSAGHRPGPARDPARAHDPAPSHDPAPAVTPARAGVGTATLDRPTTKAGPMPEAALTPSGINGGAIQPLWKIEKDAIESAIAYYGGNIPKAAAALEIAPSTIYRKRLAWQAEGKA